MAQPKTLPSSTPPTPPESSNSFLPRATSDSASCLPEAQKYKPASQRLEPLPFSQRSHSDPLPSNLSRRFNKTKGPSKGATDVAVEHEVLSKHAGLSPTSCGVEGDRDKIMKRHSHPCHINRHTECGRHGDDWLFGGFSVVELVKRIFKKRK
jgi:hypothetical protein